MTADAIPPDVAHDLQAGRLEKACPRCGTWEAASIYCSKCLRPSVWSEWYRNGDVRRRREARQDGPRTR